MGIDEHLLNLCELEQAGRIGSVLRSLACDLGVLREDFCLNPNGK